MTKFNSGKASVLVLTAIFAVGSFLLGKLVTTNVFAYPAGDVPKAYCHAAGQEGTTKFNYHYNKAWTAHFDDAGAPRAGHEDDFYTEVGDQDCNHEADPTPSPTPSDCGRTCPSPTPIPEDDACPNLEGTQTSVPEGYIVNNNDECVPEPTPTPGNGDICANIDGIQTTMPEGLHQNANNCINFSDPGAPPPSGGPQGQVLGTSTMAATGSFAENAYLAIMVLGGTLSAFGLKGFKKAFQKAN